jgi:hypothetical protein
MRPITCAADSLQIARELLETPAREERWGAALAASALAAVASLVLAAAVVLGPGFEQPNGEPGPIAAGEPQP